MRQDQLPSPGIYVNSQRLRVEAAKAISHAEITFNLTGEVTTEHAQLRSFFLACADAVDFTLPGEGE